ncbi:MAG TPA: phage holin family protein [Terriglobales bacterium]|nr:phage holin family protein [Terriglobales bacterium]
MINETRYGERNGRTLADVLSEIKDELKEFLQTRVQMLVSELGESLKNSKSAAILGGAALFVLATAWLLLNLALVGLVAVAFWGSAYAWFFGFLIVGLFWAIVGGMLGLAAQRPLRGLAPRKTIQVLKEDKIWLQQEARSHV